MHKGHPVNTVCAHTVFAANKQFQVTQLSLLKVNTVYQHDYNVTEAIKADNIFNHRIPLVILNYNAMLQNVFKSLRQI